MSRMLVNEVVLMPGDVLIVDELCQVIVSGNVRCSDDGRIIKNGAKLSEIPYADAASFHDDGRAVFEKCAEFTGAWRV